MVSCIPKNSDSRSYKQTFSFVFGFLNSVLVNGYCEFKDSSSIRPRGKSNLFWTLNDHGDFPDNS